MKITASTELMHNHKHAEIMSPDSAFEVLQTPDGDALFFSIGTDHRFYVTREQRASGTGWTRVDLSSTLASQFAADTTITVKSFALAQNAATLDFDLALVVNAAGADHLYLSWNNSNKAEAWANGVSWVPTPFDATPAQSPEPLTIADVYLMNIPTTGGGTSQTCVVDIIRTPGDTLQLLDRYYVDLTASKRWILHGLAEDLKAGSIKSFLGRREHDRVPGMYTFGAIDSEQQLFFTPLYNFFNPDAAPTTAKLALPADATAIATVANSQGNTNLFVAAGAGLHLFTPDNQHGGDTQAELVVPNSRSALSKMASLSALTVGIRTVVWGVNVQGDLIYATCPAGQEGVPSSWSAPVPLETNVEQYAFYLNIQSNNNVVFVQGSHKLVQLTQDAVTGHWTERKILLPSTETTDMVDFLTYTTHITLTDDKGLPLADTTTVQLKSTSPVPVYVNNVYHVLNPSLPVSVNPDPVGHITVIQETNENLTGVCFTVSVANDSSSDDVLAVDPLSKPTSILSKIQSGKDLDDVKITTSDGSQKSLIPDGVSGDDKDAAAKAIANLVNVKNTLPSDGSVMKPHGTTMNAVNPIAQQLPHTWGLSFGSDGVQYHEGHEAASKLLSPKHQGHLLGDGVIETIFVAAGDFFHHLFDTVVDGIMSIVVKVQEDGLWGFFVGIGDLVYHVVVDCVSAAVGAIKSIFKVLKVLVEDLIAMIGALFHWGDIVRTHSVIKNFCKQLIAQSLGSVDSATNAIIASLAEMENSVNAWADITDPGTTIGAMKQQGDSTPGSDNPQAHWGMYHLQNGASSPSVLQSDPRSDGHSGGDDDALSRVIKDMEELVTNEIGDFETAFDQIKTQVFDNITSLSPLDVIKKILAIIADLVLKSAENVIAKTADFLKIAVNGLLDALDQPLDIPILSPLYHAATGNDMSILDVVCLVCAIPVNVIHAAVTGGKDGPLFPDTQHTRDLVAASSLAELSRLIMQRDSKPNTLFRAAGTHASLLSDSNGPTVPPWAFHFTSILAFVGGIGVAILDGIKASFAAGVPAKLRLLSFCFFPMYVAPNFSGSLSDTRTAGANLVITFVAIVKTATDNFGPGAVNKEWQNGGSKWLEGVINFVWLWPLIETAIEERGEEVASDWVAVAGNAVFDIGGMATMATIRWPTFTYIARACPVVYGILMLASGTMKITNQ
ncbi:hypothetical protein B0T25DRAFT_581707 [Lasiosphaeria hispida]|uniref:Uncharacterized protein n=1 Tax=Lasiosphaeria hispida TaxID=260671 RepID=A0AAJ0MF15_9PEZI|nr:hypothetical protein B0T25DRAFT_581707 [Lasiosphaeria hispida]